MKFNISKGWCRKAAEDEFGSEIGAGGIALRHEWLPIKTATTRRGMMAEWQPIETAPKDGTIVLVATDTPVGIGMYFWGTDYFNNPCWLEMGIGVVRNDRPLPTHWMPLPSHPQGEE